MTRQVVVGAAIVREGLLLVAQRSYPAELAGLWELPGGGVEPGESEIDALRRECIEELEVDVRVGPRVGAEVQLPGERMLRIYAAALSDPAGEPRAVTHEGLRWLGAEALDAVDWLPADRELLPALAELLTVGEDGVGGR